MTHFDPNNAAPKDSGIFGLPFTEDESQLVLIPVPWEATTSYGGGTSNGPNCILNASRQIDLFDIDLGNFYAAGIALLPEPQPIQEWNNKARQLARSVIDHAGTSMTPALQKKIDEVNAYSHQVNHSVYQTTQNQLAQGKCVGIIGGDHASPFGAIQAFLEKHPDMGILHFDAHADLRECFEGFEYSHASIMYNVMTKTPLKKLVQVGIRDFCEAEFDFIQKNHHRIITFFDTTLAEKKFQGENWSSLCENIIEHLPREVYISFDIDGLDPRFCPHTGTPVPGGLTLQEAFYLIKTVVRSGRKIIGFDLTEVSPGSSEALSEEPDPAAEWDANVGARLLYKLCGWTLVS